MREWRSQARTSASCRQPGFLDWEAGDFQLRQPRKPGWLQLSLDLAWDLHLMIQTSLFACGREKARILDDQSGFASEHPENLVIKTKEPARRHTITKV